MQHLISLAAAASATATAEHLVTPGFFNLAAAAAVFALAWTVTAGAVRAALPDTDGAASSA